MKREELELYTDYLISGNGFVTATGLSEMLDGEISHDKVTRFLYPKGRLRARSGNTPRRISGGK